MSWMLLIALGCLAGGVTTWVGLGGGVALTLILAVWFGPEAALAVAAPALWVGNAHRLFLFGRSLHRRAFRWLGVSAAIGALVGGVLATALSESVLRILLMLAPALALISAFEVPRGVRRIVSVPFGLAAGVASATSGGGGALMGPALLSWGLKAEAFLATSSAIALAIHSGRIIAYATGGWVTTDRLLMAAVVAMCVPIGNLGGRWLRLRTSEVVLDWGLRSAAVGLAVLGVVNLGL